jgi:transposase
MRPHQTTAPQAPARVGVGIDTARYGHYAAFLTADLQPAAPELAFAESAQGYDQLRQRLELIARRHPGAAVHVRVDAAGHYADNLIHFLHQIAQQPGTQACALPGATLTLSCGDPQRNKNYRAALFGAKKSDAVEARAAAAFAATHRPAPALPRPAAAHALRHTAARLQATARQRTRLVNQFHQLLALTFPELALVTKDVAAGWVLELVHRYPTARLLAAATADDLAAVPYLPDKHVADLLDRARASVASLAGPAAEELLRDQVRQLRDAQARQKRLENLLIGAYRALPAANHVDSIPGIGDVTASVLTAVIGDIDRFATPGKLVAYFGTPPVEAGSGADRDGRPRPPRRFVMSRRGNDLVRRYLWMAALSAIRHNPAARALFRRVAAKHPNDKTLAVGHVMRKLLHLVFAIWRSGKPFDPAHYPWEGPAAGDPADGDGLPAEPEAVAEQAAGHNPEWIPEDRVVTAACPATVAAGRSAGEGTFIDFAHLKSQLPLLRVLEHLGLSSRLRGSGPQRRCACPIHRGDARGRTFSVNLDDNVFHCFDKACGQQGDVIDLWAALHHLGLREAALDLVQTFDLEPAPARGTEKRHG